MLLGNDGFARAAAVRSIEEALGGGENLDRTVVRAEEVGVDSIAVAVGSSSLFGEPRLVVVRDFERLAAADQARLVPLLSAPASGLVVIVTAGALDGRRNATKALTAAGRVFTFTLPEGQALTRWVIDHARTLGLDMPTSAVDTLLELVPPEPQMLHTELEKLALYTAGAPADATAVREVASLAVPFAAERLIFQLTEFIVNGQTQPALAALHDLLSVGEVPLVVLTMIGRQYRLLSAAVGVDGAQAKHNLTRVFRLPPFIADRTARQARALGAPAIEAGLRRVLAADEGMKKSQEPRLALETLVVALAQRQ